MLWNSRSVVLEGLKGSQLAALCMPRLLPKIVNACVPSFMAGMGPGRPVASAILGNQIETLVQDTFCIEADAELPQPLLKAALPRGYCCRRRAVHPSLPQHLVRAKQGKNPEKGFGQHDRSCLALLGARAGHRDAEVAARGGRGRASTLPHPLLVRPPLSACKEGFHVRQLFTVSGLFGNSMLVLY